VRAIIACAASCLRMLAIVCMLSANLTLGLLHVCREPGVPECFSKKAFGAPTVLLYL